MPGPVACSKIAQTMQTHTKTSSLFLALIVVTALLNGCGGCENSNGGGGGCGNSGGGGTITPPPNMIWGASAETGNFSEWNGDGGGDVFRRLNEADVTSPEAIAEISQDRARSGQRSVKFSIRTDQAFYPNAAKGQVVRWNEPRQNTDYYYSVWFFIPQPFNAWPDGPSGGQGWLNLFQFHSVSNAGRVHSGVVLFGRSHPTTGRNYFELFLSPDFGNNISPLNSPVDMPFGRWFNIEMRMKCAANRQGLVQVWQDGVQIFNLPNVTTNQPYADAYCHWMVNAYGQYMLPSPTVIYVDDVVISTGRVWQGG